MKQFASRTRYRLYKIQKCKTGLRKYDLSVYFLSSMAAIIIELMFKEKKYGIVF